MARLTPGEASLRMRTAIEEVVTEIEKLEHLLRRAEEVLRPFAVAATVATDKPQDHRPLRLVIWDYPYELTLGDLRAAAALLLELEGSANRSPATTARKNIHEALTRCDQCDNGIEQAWNYCAWCGHELVLTDETEARP